MPCRLRLAGVCVLLAVGAALVSHAPADEAAPVLAPRTATIKAMTLQGALKELQTQTGNQVHDRRANRTDPMLALSRGNGPFWPLLDTIGQSTGIGFTPYGPDGTVALVDAPYRAVPIAYSGLFRLALKRIALSHDFESMTHSCHVTLDVAWEPHFRPFYLDTGTLTATYAPDAKGKTRTEKVSQRGQQPIAGRGATELEVRFPAPERTSPRIDRLEGSLSVLGPTRMLDFSFDRLAPLTVDQRPREAMQDGVKVSLTRVVAGRERWSFDVLIENPPGGPVLESYQSWLDNNRLALVHEANGKRLVWTSDPNEEQQLGQVTARRAAVRYHFPIESGKRLPMGGLSAWSLHYRTPARLVQLAVPFTFRDVPLP